MINMRISKGIIGKAIAVLLLVAFSAASLLVAPLPAQAADWSPLSRAVFTVTPPNEGAHTVTIYYSQSTLALKNKAINNDQLYVYKDAEFTQPVDIGQAADSKIANQPVRAVTFRCEPGLYFFKTFFSEGEDAVQASDGVFSVDEEGPEEQAFYLIPVQIVGTPTRDPVNPGPDDGKGWEFKLFDIIEREIAPLSSQPNPKGGYNNSVYFVCVHQGQTLRWEATPVDPNYSWEEGEITLLKNDVTPAMLQLPGTNKSGVGNPQKNRTVTFRVPQGAPFMPYRKPGIHWQPFVKYQKELIGTEDGYDIYQAKVPIAFAYMAGGGASPYVKTAQRFCMVKEGAVITLDLDLLTEDENTETTLGVKDDLYLNVNDSQYLVMQAEKPFELVPIRIWQGLRPGDEVSNDFVNPDYAVEVVNVSGEVHCVSNDNPGRDSFTLTAARPGLSVVKVTYGPLRWFPGREQHEPVEGEYAPTGGCHHNAIDPINTGVFIINTVAGDPEAANNLNLQTNIAAREVDTYYFDRDETDHADYTFKPTADSGKISVRLHDPLHNTEWGDEEAWTSYAPNADGSFTVSLKEGRSIVEVSSSVSDFKQYHVLNAKGVRVNITNLSDPGWQKGDSFRCGDTALLSFDGIRTPLAKLAGIYNPSDSYVRYKTPAGGTVDGYGDCYKLAQKNGLKITLTEPGELRLREGAIFCAHWGSPPGSHHNIGPEGYAPNLNAPSTSTLYGALPDVTLRVEDDAFAAERARDEYALPGSIVRLMESNRDFELLEGFGAFRNLNIPRTIMNSQEKNARIDILEINSNLSLFMRYWLQNSASDRTEAYLKIWDSAAGQSFYKQPLQEGDVLFAELIFTPDNPSLGNPLAYTFRQVRDADFGKFPYIQDLSLSLEETRDADYYSGRLLSVDGEGNPAAVDDGAGKQLSLGWGFLSTRNSYVTHVPHSVNTVTVNVTPFTEENGKATSVTVNGKPVAGGKSQPITLTGEETSITVEGKAADIDNTVTYTITVVRAAAPTSFAIDTEEGTTLTIRNAAGYRIEPDEDGKYPLPVRQGYKYYYEKPGYLTKTGSFDVEEDTESITLPSFTEGGKIAQTAGSAKVTVAAQNSILRDQHTVAFDPASVPNLAQQGYVEYNHGGYTVLHALLNALDACRADYSCFKGMLAPQTKTSGKVGANAGWICEVNGVKVTDYANTLVTDGDAIAFYYNADTSEDMLHARFEETSLRAPKDGSATLTLKATPVGNSDPDAKASPVERASIYLADKELGKTDTKGQITISNLSDLSLGTYAVTARKADQDGNEMLTYACALLTVTKTDSGPTPGDKVAVSFRLIGATPSSGEIDLSDGDYKGSEYVTWIKTASYNLDQGSSVFDLFDMALKEESMDYVAPAEHSNNYISSIQAPPALEGYWLAEFDNGYNSGWMYTVNGSHPNVGLKDYELKDGDEVIWHYVNDYLYEVNDWFDGTLGNSSTWSKWLEAADETLASNAADVGEAKSTVKSLDYTLSMATANTEAAVKPWIEAQIAKLDLNGVAADVVMNSFTPAVAATEANPSGTEGGFTFTVYLSKGEGEALASDSLQISGRVTVPLPGDIEEARKVDDLIAKIGDPVTLADKAKIEEARAAYNALTDPQKNLVTKLEDLQAAEAKLGDLQEAKAVEDKIAAIGTVTLESKAKIEAARAAYNALPTAQADLVSNYQTLAAAEAAYAALLAEKENAEEARKVDDLIAKIGDPVTLADKAKIAEARAAYNALTDPQKDLVTKLDQLKAAEAALAQLLKPVQDAEKLIDELPAAISGSEADQLALLKASTAFDKLSDQEKAELDQKLQEKLLSLREEAAKINHTSNGVQIGNIPWNIVLIATPISKGEDDYEAMRKEAENKLGAGRSILGMYDLSLQELTESGLVEYRLDGKTAQITITVPDLTKYKNIKIIHQLADGSYEYIEPTKIDGNKVTFIVESLSKYAVVGQLIEAEPEPTPPPGDENKNGKPSAGGKQTGTGSATGDHSAVPTTAALLLIALCACGYLYSRKRREENGL